MVKSARVDRVASLIAFLGPLLAYGLTLAPDITWAYQGADGGDLITAAYTLGVPHPSGYPTYVLLGWAISRPELGSIAWRFNAMSALFMAGAAWFTFKVVKNATGFWFAALVAAWTFAFLPLVWSQAIITEVYGLHLFFVALLIWLGMQIRTGRTGLAFRMGVSFGLALGAHLTVLWLLPVLVWAIWPRLRDKWLQVGLGLGLGLLIFAYLPLRAGQGAITWGEPNTPAGFLALVSGQIYRDYLFSLPVELLAPRLLALAGYLSQMGLLALTLLGAGIWWAWRYARQALVWAAISAGCYAVYALGYRTADSFVYLLPIFVLAAIGVGLGANDIIGIIPIPYRQAAIWGSLGLIIVWAGVGGVTVSLKGEQQAATFWRTVFAQAPADAVLLTYQDNHTFTLWYAQHVLQQRPDVTIVDTGLLGYDWYVTDLRRAYPWLNLPPDMADRFARAEVQPYPLCAVIKMEQPETWQLECLIAPSN